MPRLVPLRARDDVHARVSAAIAQAVLGRPQLIVVSGLRRVGKTLLVQHALASMEGEVTPVYFAATQAGAPEELRRFTERLSEVLGAGSIPPGFSPRTWEEALRFVAFAARSRPIALAIDEATYLMESSPGFAGMVQAVWDEISMQADPPRLAIVLTGSALGLVESMLSGRGALFQRPTLAVRLDPFTPAQAYDFCGRPDPVSLFEGFAACGGYPLHLDTWDFEQTAESNLLRMAFSPGSVLLEAGSLTLAALSEANRRVLYAVGEGRARSSDIAGAVGTRPDRSLDALQRSRLVSAVRPLRAPLKVRPEYRIADSFLRFWFRVLANSVQLIEAGQGAAVMARSEGAWKGQLGWVFEQAARDHAVRLVSSGVLPSDTEVGEWWATGGVPVQVDVLGLRGKETVLVGEARWQAQPLGANDVRELNAKLQLVPSPAFDRKLILWGRGGVRPEVQVGGVSGFGPLEMLSG